MKQNKTISIMQKYYQPEIDSIGDITGHPGESIPSFLVWEKKENLLNEYPNCKPIEYSGNDIEEPTYADKGKKIKLKTK